MDSTVRSIRASDGAELRFERTNGDGLPVVFLHGSMSGRSSFAKLRGAFAGDVPLISTVLRGHEDVEPSLPADYGLATTEVGDLATILDAEHIDRVHLVGHSTGGSIAVAFALSRPERVGRMVLIEPTLLSLLDDASFALFRDQCAPLLAAVDRGDHLDALRGMLAVVGGTVWDGLTSQVQQKVQGALAPLAGLVGPHLRAIINFQLSTTEVLAVQQPSLLVYGTNSPWFEPIIAEQLRALRPDFPRLDIQGAGHTSHIEQPGIVGPAAAKFLNALAIVPST